MFCPKCGAQNPDGAMFCAGCGNKFAAPATQAPTPQMQQNFAQPQVQPGQQVNRAQYATAQRGIAPTSASASLLPVFNYGSIAAAIVGIVAFFLPMLTMNFSASLFGVDAGSANLSISGLQMVTGCDVTLFGYTDTMSGEISNLLYVVPFIVALVFCFVLKGKARWIVQIICAAVSLFMSVSANGYLQQEFGSLETDFGVGSASAGYSLGIGFYLMVIAGIALLALAIFALVKNKQQR